MDAPVGSSTRSAQSSVSSTAHPSPTTTHIAPPPRRDYKTPSTDPFLKDFTLVAEAAKRAQMAVMMRDFESVGLS